MLRNFSLKSNGFLLVLLILQVAVYSVIFVDLPVGRAVICFVYLLFVPGVVILKLLAIKTLDVSCKVLFSVGLSIAFLMIVGVGFNELGKLVVGNPLSLNILTVGINTIVLLFALMSTFRGGSDSTHDPRMDFSSYLLIALLSISLLILGSYGIFVVNVSGSNTFVILLIVAVAVIVALVILKEKVVSSQFHPIVLLIVFVCMLLFVSTGYALATPYIIMRGDQWNEYYVFERTGQLWDSQISKLVGFYATFYSMPSVTILPSIFSTVTNMDSNFLFKLLYPLVASFAAIGVYGLYKTQTDNKTAFLAAFFFIAVSVGKSMGPARQQIGELFYILLFLVLFLPSISPLKRNILLMVFGAGLVLSHYSLAYIFLFILLAYVIISAVLQYYKTGHFRFPHGRVSLFFVVFFMTITFSWNVYVDGAAAFDPLINAITRVTSSFNQFFNPASRGSALETLNAVQAASVLQRLSSYLFVFTEILLTVGFFVLLRSKDKDSNYSTDYKILAFLNLLIIALNLLLPNLADTFLMSRFYQITLITLSPLMVLGGKALYRLLLRGRFEKFYVPVLVLLVIIPLFLFQTNLVYEVAGDKTYNIVLSMHRWSAQELHEYYATNAKEVAGAHWIYLYTKSSTVVYSDYESASSILNAYGLRIGSRVLSGVIEPSAGSLIYLPNVDLVNDKNFQNSSLIPSMLERKHNLLNRTLRDIRYSKLSLNKRVAQCPNLETYQLATRVWGSMVIRRSRFEKLGILFRRCISFCVNQL